ncbi:hypothetical protein ACR6A7_18530 [Pantoea sp. RRHST58]|uniref:primase 1D-like protein n=1 Tax=Pantoea sp. RRHST58 TaxID=3425183 RepID=UPI003DA05365
MNTVNSRSPVNDIISLSRLDPILASHHHVFFYFSKYKDSPFSSERITIEVSKKNLNHEKIEEIISSLDASEELSVLSKINVNGTIYHLPMIDFLSKKRSSKSIDLSYELSHAWNMNLNIYDSGRSIHAYGTHLLTLSQWIKFMGYLLLLNEKSGEKVIDVRWIGHRLMSGFASLRITNNSGRHKYSPKYIGSTLFNI